MFFSIIMPVYNGEKYITDTIGSILNQSYPDFELIIVDDGSNDNSKKVIEQISLKDNRIKLVYQDNEGICNARNTGIEMASGEYILFCDHDDLFLKDFLLYAENILSNKQYDFVKFSYKEIYLYGNGTRKEQLCEIENCELDGNLDSLLLEYGDFNEYIWDGVYKRSVLMAMGGFDERFKAGCEDVDLMLRLIVNARNCKIDSRVVYEHYIRDASSTSRKYSENAFVATTETYHRRILMAEKNIYFQCEDKEHFKEYCRKKTEQYAWALLGMFSFNTCDLSFSFVRQRIKKIREDSQFARYIKIRNRGIPIIKKIVFWLYMYKCYSVLALVCVLKRKRK